MKTKRSEGIVPSILNIGARDGEWLAAHTGCFTTFSHLRGRVRTLLRFGHRKFNSTENLNLFARSLVSVLTELARSAL
jgi:hypothetical protein